jgi:hypothetical protein
MTKKMPDAKLACLLYRSRNAIAHLSEGKGAMNEDIFNMDVRKFLKTVGVTSQREIEAAVRQALAAGKLSDRETLQARMVLTIDRLGLSREIAGTIKLS